MLPMFGNLFKCPQSCSSEDCRMSLAKKTGKKRKKNLSGQPNSAALNAPSELLHHFNLMNTFDRFNQSLWNVCMSCVGDRSRARWRPMPSWCSLKLMEWRCCCVTRTKASMSTPTGESPRTWCYSGERCLPLLVCPSTRVWLIRKNMSLFVLCINTGEVKFHFLNFAVPMWLEWILHVQGP